MPADQQYASGIRRETSLFANWQPNAPREIGDYGPVNGAIFQYYDRLDTKEIQALGERPGTSAASYDIMIHSTRSLQTDLSAEAKAMVGSGKALLEIKFSKKDGVVFAAPSTKVTEIASMPELGRILSARHRAGNWNMDHAVVVQVSVAERATILVSTEASAGMGFAVDASVPVNAQLVANLHAGQSCVSSHGVGVDIVGEGPITPLFKLAYLKKRFRKDPEIVYREVLPAEMGSGIDVYDVDDDHVLIVG